MPARESPTYVVGFAAAVCVACAMLVSVSAVALRERQEDNRLVYRQKNVLLAAGLIPAGERFTNQQVLDTFEQRIRIRLVDLDTGLPVKDPALDPRSYDAAKAKNDPALSREAPANGAQVRRLPKVGAIYVVERDGRVEQLVIPIEGAGMWGLVSGFLALDRDTTTVRGITFHDHKETPGLGAEISEPKWQALWLGRKAYDAKWEPALAIIKGAAGTAQADPHRIDGISGATITASAVSRILAFWLSEAGFGKVLKTFRETGWA